MATVRGLLRNLDFADKPVLIALNKIDRCDPSVVAGLVRSYGGVPISALDSGTFGPLLKRIEENLWGMGDPVDDGSRPRSEETPSLESALQKDAV